MSINTPQPKMAVLDIIDFEALLNKDIPEIQKLVQASQTVGMFYLDLRGTSTRIIFEDMPIIFEKAHQFFNLPQDSVEKVGSLREGLERGYHFAKQFEYYEIARDEFQLGKWTLPATFELQRDRIARIIKTFNDAVQTVLYEVCAAANIRIPELSDDPTVSSDTALKLVYKPPIHDAGKVIHPWHTDFGLVTLLWYDEETTQLPIFNEKGDLTEASETVSVVEGCVLVNIADHIATKSEGYLHSTIHRVVAPPGARRTRNGIIYLLRPYNY